MQHSLRAWRLQRKRSRVLLLPIACLVGLLLPGGASADDEIPLASDAASTRLSRDRPGRALIVVGLPGDAERARRFEEIEGRWLDWLTGPLGFAPADITVLSGRSPRENSVGETAKAQASADTAAAEAGGGAAEAQERESGSPSAIRRGPATRESLEATLAPWNEQLGGEDRLWVFLLGHGNHDGERAFFHLPGPDVSDRDLGILFERLRCGEQVFWLTHSCSGWCIDRLSRPDRIVIAATEAAEENNETEFPGALAAVGEQAAASLDRDENGRISVLEVFAATVQEVGNIFEAGNLAPTEHAQLDDNGDRRGTELPGLRASGDSEGTPDTGDTANAGDAADVAAEPPPRRPDDGQRAARTYLFRVEPASGPPDAAKASTSAEAAARE